MTDKEKLFSLGMNAPLLKLKAAINVLDGKESCEKPQKWLSEKEAMKYASVGRSTLWLWRTKLGLVSHLVRGRRLFRATDIDAFIINQAKGGK